MRTTAEIAVFKAALQSVRDGFNVAAVQMNLARDALRPISAEPEIQPSVRSFNVVVAALNKSGDELLDVIAAVNALVPSDPPPGTPTRFPIPEPEVRGIGAITNPATGEVINIWIGKPPESTTNGATK